MKVEPKIYQFEFSEHNCETPFVPLPLVDSAECNKLLASKFINLRLIMFQMPKWNSFSIGILMLQANTFTFAFLSIATQNSTKFAKLFWLMKTMNFFSLFLHIKLIHFQICIATQCKNNSVGSRSHLFNYFLISFILFFQLCMMISFLTWFHFVLFLIIILNLKCNSIVRKLTNTFDT